MTSIAIGEFADMRELSSGEFDEVSGGVAWFALAPIAIAGLAFGYQVGKDWIDNLQASD